jgi:hypothetical protein
MGYEMATAAIEVEAHLVKDGTRMRLVKEGFGGCLGLELFAFINVPIVLVGQDIATREAADRDQHDGYDYTIQ